MKNITILALISILLFCTNCSYKKKLTAENILLSPLYSSGMILQTQPKTSISGYAEPGSTLAVKIGSYLRMAQTNSDGTWEVKFPGIEGSNAITICIEGKDTTIILSNVLPGKVFVVLGNVGLDPLTARNTNLIEKLDDIDISRVKIFRPEPELSDSNLIGSKAGSWKHITKTDVRTNRVLRAVAEYAKQESGAIGIIDITIPGAQTSAWLPMEQVNDTNNLSKSYSNYLTFNKALLDTVCYMKDSLRNGIKKGATRLWFKGDEMWWNARMPIHLGKRAISSSRQICYMRKKMTISERYITSNFTIELGDVQGEAEYYFNQHRVQAVPNTKPVQLNIPDTLVRNWTNVLAIRFFSPDTAAGIFGDDFRCFNEDSTYYKEITTKWKYTTQLEERFPEYELQLSDTGALYNTFIQAHNNHPAYGVIWYNSDTTGSAAIFSSFPAVQHQYTYLPH